MRLKKDNEERSNGERKRRKEEIEGRKMKYCMFSPMQNLDLRYMCACTHMTRPQKKKKKQKRTMGTQIRQGTMICMHKTVALRARKTARW